MKIRSRAEWGAAAPKRVSESTPSSWEGFVLHWFGSPRAVRWRVRVAAQLRSVQRGHLQHPTENYSDIAYSFAVDPWGDVWELRGWNRKAGANGNADANRRYGAIVAMIGEGDKPTPAQLASIAALIAEGRRRGVGSGVKPHGAITGSACPGPELRAWIARRGYVRPTGQAPKPAPPLASPSFDVLGPKGGTILKGAPLKRVRELLPALVKRFGRVTVKRKGSK